MATNNSDETSEELHAEEELPGEPAPPAQKSAPSKIKPTIPVDNDDSSLVDSWGDNNFPKAERAKARAAMEDTKEAAVKVVLAEAAAADTELEQAQLATAAATTAVSLIGEQVGDGPATSDCSASEYKGPEEQEVGKELEGNTRPNNSRKVNIVIDGAEAEQYKADRKSGSSKGDAADGIGSHGQRPVACGLRMRVVVARDLSA